MGFFGGDDNPNQETNDLMNQQIRQNQAELESKRQNLYSEKLDIIKGTGGETWQPNRSAGVSASGNPAGGNAWFPGGFRFPGGFKMDR